MSALDNYDDANIHNGNHNHTSEHNGSDVTSPVSPIPAPDAAGMGMWDPPAAMDQAEYYNNQQYQAEGAAAAPKESKLKPIRYKTKMCRHLQETGACPYLARCVFAHSAEELRTTENNQATGITTDQALKDTQRHATMAAAAMATLPPPIVHDGSVPNSPVLPAPGHLHPHLQQHHLSAFPDLQVAIPPYGGGASPTSPIPSQAASMTSAMSPPGTCPHGGYDNYGAGSPGAMSSPMKPNRVPPTPPGYDGYRHNPYSETPYVYTKTPRATSTSPTPLGE